MNIEEANAEFEVLCEEYGDTIYVRAVPGRDGELFRVEVQGPFHPDAVKRIVEISERIECPLPL